jgi:pimeloyl-ACP methyl ester carboxylesterase
MPILRLNAGRDALVLNCSPASAASALQAAARGTGPVMILIHGFKYDPDCPSCSPHATIFGRGTNAGSIRKSQWLRHLGFGTGGPNEGLAIAFSWRARGNIWNAVRSARAAGQQLAQVIREIHARAPDRPIHVITHSMGSEVIFEALETVPANAVQRIVAISGASYVSRAKAAMNSPAGRAAELINVTSRESDVFDFLFERLIAPPVRGDRALGAGLNLVNTVNIQLDCPATLAALTGLGARIEAPERRVCHWSGYTRSGALPFYARCLRAPNEITLQQLQDTLPATPARRWSRLFAVPRTSWVLPMVRKPAS